MAKKDTAIQVKNETAGQLQGEAENLIAKAIDKSVPVETMEKLLAMRRELKAERAKEEYDQAMANFQANCPTIKKTKVVKTSGGAEAYKYAPIDSIVAQVKNILQENGFSYSTNMKLLAEGVEVSVKVTHKAGHSEVTEMTVPLGTKTNIMSQSQVVAAAQTFAKRYAFCNAFGILTGDEDTDATPSSMGQQQPARPTYQKPAYQKPAYQKPATPAPVKPTPAKEGEVIDGEVAPGISADDAEFIDESLQTNCTCGATAAGQKYHGRQCPMFGKT